LYLTASAALQVKKFDSDGDGKYSIEELATMTPSDAVALLKTLVSAGDFASQISAEGTGQSTTAAKSIQNIQAKIDASPGDTDEEKLKNYLQDNQTPAQ